MNRVCPSCFGPLEIPSVVTDELRMRCPACKWAGQYRDLFIPTADVVYETEETRKEFYKDYIASYSKTVVEMCMKLGLVDSGKKPEEVKLMSRILKLSCERSFEMLVDTIEEVVNGRKQANDSQTRSIQR